MQSFIFTALVAFAVGFPLTNSMSTSHNTRNTDVTSKMQWEGLSNGQNVTLYGTATEIMEQLKAADPNWIPANNATAPIKLSMRGQASKLNCCPVRGQSWNPVSIESLQTGLNRLNQIGGTCSQAAHSCSAADSSNGAAACVLGAGIHICNNNAVTVHMDCSSVAAYALSIIEQCPHTGNGDVCGQVFDKETSASDDYNIVLSQC